MRILYASAWLMSCWSDRSVAGRLSCRISWSPSTCLQLLVAKSSPSRITAACQSSMLLEEGRDKYRVDQDKNCACRATAT